MGFRESGRENRWCPTHQESLPCSVCTADNEKARAKKLIEKSLAEAEPAKPATIEKKGSIESTVGLLSKKVDLLSPVDLKSFVTMVAESEGVLPKHLRALGDAYRSLPERKPIPPSVQAMMRQMGKQIPPEISVAEKIKMALTQLSDDERLAVSKTLEPYINRSEKRGQRSA